MWVHFWLQWFLHRGSKGPMTEDEAEVVLDFVNFWGKAGGFERDVLDLNPDSRFIK